MTKRPPATLHATRARALAGLLAAALSIAASRRAMAFEDQLHLGAGAGTAGFVAAGQQAGTAAAAYLAYGWTDAFDLRFETLFVDPPDPSGERGARTLHRILLGGLTYKVDVLEWIPYIGVLVGHYSFGAARPPDVGASGVGVALPAGLDWAPTRELGLGVQLGYHGSLAALPSFGAAPYFSAALRAEYRWGW
ncbi:MAG: hypothetical protein IT376_16920 [Polyangiaceae bacterium]|nr:hypothetical protein [Polyangiaceae bacterium]